jgi:23S rRNA (uracil1939-C5)-methyltransferase
MDEPISLPIERLGPRGEGLARFGDALISIPGALPGEQALAQINGERGALIEILRASPERTSPICRYFGVCGGCATQHFSAALYSNWKRAILLDALRQARIEAPVGALIDAHGEGRRRATFHARFEVQSAHIDVGFMRARAHDIVNIDSCPILAPALSGALNAARDVAQCLRGVGKPLDVAIVATLNGLDIDIRGCGALDSSMRLKLTDAAARLDIARLSNHGETILERRAPEVLMGSARVLPPPGGFLQATLEGERILGELAVGAVAGARRVADLFCGAGAFALRLAVDHEVHAVEFDRPALAALAQAAGATPGLRAVTCEVRDLYHRPLTRDELRRFDAVVFDPPRAGALAQSQELAASGVQTIVAVSCNAATFARDIGILRAGGYRLDSVAPIDQFRFSPHIEIVGVLTKTTERRPPKGRRRRGFLG